MAWPGSASGASRRWSEKRRHPRKGIVFSAETDFTVPSKVSISEISRGGLVLSGVQSIGMRNGGWVQFCLPGRQVTSQAKVRICWSDRHERLGLKFIEFQGVAPDWDSWFAANLPEQAEPSSEIPGGPPPLESTAEQVGAASVSAFTRPFSAQAIAERLAQSETVTGLEEAEDVEESASPGQVETYPFRRDLQRVLQLWWLWLLVIALMTLILLIGRSPGAATALLRRAISERSTKHPAPRAAKPASALPEGASVEIIEGRPAPQAGSRWRLRLIGDAQAVSQTPPSYPAPAQEAGLQGDVEAELMIDTQGLVEEVRIVRGSPLLAQEVMQAASHWRYSPFHTEAGRVAVKLPVTVKFRKSEAARVRR